MPSPNLACDVTNGSFKSVSVKGEETALSGRRRHWGGHRVPCLLPKRSGHPVGASALDVASAPLIPSLECLIFWVEGVREIPRRCHSAPNSERDAHSKPSQWPRPGICQGSWSVRGRVERSPLHLSPITLAITGHWCSPGPILPGLAVGPSAAGSLLKLVRGEL